MSPIKFEILGKLPSANYLLRMHWTKRRKMIEGWAWAVKAGLQKAGCNYVGNTSYFKTKLQIDVVIFVANRSSIKDGANLITPLDKLVVDNLVNQRILVDDCGEFLEWGKVEQKIGRPERIEITLNEKEET